VLQESAPPPAPCVAVLGKVQLLKWVTADGNRTMRILVIEDETKTAKFLKKGLCEAGFVVDVRTMVWKACTWCRKWIRSTNS